ncbi:MAG: acyl carrier protein [Crocinitomicaceae bacterium]|nr:acyl carrier protein [Crocinitomicaceae bacterium]
MTLEEIFETVKEVIEKSVGKPKDSIELNDTLFDKIGIDSIDLVDILFELESHFNVELKISDFESRAREKMSNEPYEVNGLITTQGLTVLKKYMTELDQNKLVEGLTVHQLVKLLTVHSLCKIVLYKLEETKTQPQTGSKEN